MSRDLKHLLAILLAPLMLVAFLLDALGVILAMILNMIGFDDWPDNVHAVFGWLFNFLYEHFYS